MQPVLVPAAARPTRLTGPAACRAGPVRAPVRVLPTGGGPRGSPALARRALPGARGRPRGGAGAEGSAGKGALHAGARSSRLRPRSTISPRQSAEHHRTVAVPEVRVRARPGAEPPAPFWSPAGPALARGGSDATPTAATWERRVPGARRAAVGSRVLTSRALPASGSAPRPAG